MATINKSAEGLHVAKSATRKSAGVATAKKKSYSRVGSKKQAVIDDQIDLQHILRHWNYCHKKFRKVSYRWEDSELYELGDFDALAETGGAGGRSPGGSTGSAVTMVSGPLASPPLPAAMLEAGAGEEEGVTELMPANSSASTTTVSMIESRDEESLMNFILHMDVNNLEELYTKEEQNYIEHQNTQFWQKWAEYNLGPEVISLQIQWARTGGELHPSFFTIGNRQLRERIIGFVFEYDDLDRLPSKDFISLLRHNVKLGGMLYNIFAYSLGAGDKQQFYTLGKSDMEQWQASNLNPIGLTEVFKAIPISKTAKRKVNKILNYFKHYFLADPKVFVIVLGMVLYNPKGLKLEAQDKAEAIQQEYVTMLRRYLCQRGEAFCQHAVKIIFECIDILPTMFKLFSLCNDPVPVLEPPMVSSLS